MNNLNCRVTGECYVLSKRAFLDTPYIYEDTRLLGRFAPIFYFNCEHVLLLIVNIKKQRRKHFADFIKKIRGFSKLKKFKIMKDRDFFL